jgi:flavin-binding protein dodecin
VFSDVKGGLGNQIQPTGGELTNSIGGRLMSSIAKVIEVIAESEKSWDDAVKNAVTEAAKTVENITELWVGSMKAVVENNKVTKYRITAKVTFVLKGRK